MLCPPDEQYINNRCTKDILKAGDSCPGGIKCPKGYVCNRFNEKCEELFTKDPGAQVGTSDSSQSPTLCKSLAVYNSKCIERKLISDNCNSMKPEDQVCTYEITLEEGKKQIIKDSCICSASDPYVKYCKLDTTSSIYLKGVDEVKKFYDSFPNNFYGNNQPLSLAYTYISTYPYLKGAPSCVLTAIKNSYRFTYDYYYPNNTFSLSDYDTFDEVISNDLITSTKSDISILISSISSTYLITIGISLIIYALII